MYNRYTALTLCLLLCAGCGGESTSGNSSETSNGTSSNGSNNTSNGTTATSNGTTTTSNGTTGTSNGTNTSNGTTATSNGTTATSNGTTVQELLKDGSHNILFIIGDDIGVDNVSGYNEHEASAVTPEIDALAESGVLFRNAWVNPMCSPTRASLYTGRHAFRHDVLHPAGARLANSEQTIAGVLGEAGYDTALFGKWHLGNRALPTDRGFDYFIGSMANLDVGYFGWTKTILGGEEDLNEEVIEDGYATSVLVEDAKQWIADREQPWMATLAFNAPHAPMHVPPPELYSNVALEGSPGDSCGRDDANASQDCYRAMVEAMDLKIGEMLDWLETEGELDNTVVIFVGDNGTDAMGIVENDLFSRIHGKATVYEGGVNVPLIVYGPSIGVQRGTEVTDLVMGLDLFATIRDIANGKSDEGITVDSQSLYDYITLGTRDAPREFLYSEIYKATNPTVDKWAISDGTTKYLYNDGAEECYNLLDDPGETNSTPLSEECLLLQAKRPCLTAEEGCPGE